MAIDISLKKHSFAYPTKVQAAYGGGHILNFTMSANTDNGALATVGNFVELDRYETKDQTGFAGKIIAKSARGGWYIEVTDPGDAFLLYNPAISPYPERELRDEKLFYNAKGDVVRGYELAKYDYFEVSGEIIDGTAAVGKTVTFASGKYTIGA